MTRNHLVQSNVQYFLKFIKKRELRVGVIGLGYVGLPLAMCFAKAGFHVTGIDIDQKKIAQLKTGRPTIPDVDQEELSKHIRSKRFKVCQDFSILNQLQAVCVCVPTPLSNSRDPDISYIVAVTKKIKKYLHQGQVIILESTTYPGTTEEILLKEFSETGLKVGQDFFLAYSPERIDPANLEYTLENTPKVMGGITRECLKLGRALYESILEKVIPVESTQTAEMVKLLENTYRAVNIGLVNEIAIICDRLGINVWEVIEAASTKPFGFDRFLPGPGLGGHCIPVDPHYLSWKLRTMNYTARFIELASEVNREMPHYVFEKIQRALNKKQKSLNGAKILLLGVTYKKNVSDTRESPAYEIANLLHASGVKLSYSDPFVAQWCTNGHQYQSIPLSKQVFSKIDCAVLLAHHDQFNIAEIVKCAPLLIDTRYATKKMKKYHNVEVL